MKKFFSILSVVLITYFIIEIGCWWLLKNNILQIEMPTFQTSNLHSKFWLDMNSVYGVWHHPYSQYEHHKPCFDINYKANSFGMRDKERVLDSAKPRIVMLGDSFIEGFGLKEDERLSNLLETSEGVEHLNFGTSGHFGPTQYALLYKDLIKNFSHTEVIVGIYPMNDFNDDNYEIWKTSDRYRPFLIGEYPNYQIKYTSSLNVDKSSHHASQIFREYSYSYNIIFSLWENFTSHRLRRRLLIKDYSKYAGYYNYSPEDWNRMRYNLEQLINEAKGKKIIFILIPAFEDMQRYAQLGEAPFSKEMKKFATEHQVELIDLLPYFSENSKGAEEIFQTCDGHWSPHANQLAAAHIQKILGEVPVH